MGAQDVALGAKFRAKCLMECMEFIQGLKRGSPELKAAGFPENITGPRELLDTPSRDITFRMLEGDFQQFQGVWRMQQGVAGKNTTRLSYAVTVSPMRWLPVRLVQGRIEGEITSNLQAVRAYAENLKAQREQ